MHEAIMCRYAIHTYKDHFACFDCRKVFRVRPPAEWVDPAVRAGEFHPLVRCPDCRRPMINMGLDFKAPRKRDVKQWKKVEALHAAGISFHTCGCGGPGDMPGTLREVPAFLANRAKQCAKSARDQKQNNAVRRRSGRAN